MLTGSESTDRLCKKQVRSHYDGFALQRCKGFQQCRDKAKCNDAVHISAKAVSDAKFARSNLTWIDLQQLGTHCKHCYS